MLEKDTSAKEILFIWILYEILCNLYREEEKDNIAMLYSSEKIGLKRLLKMWYVTEDNFISFEFLCARKNYL